MSHRLLITAVLLLSGVSCLLGIGIKAVPATILLEEIPLGKTFDFEKEKGIVISIYNDSDQGYKYHISAERPSSSDTKATGYFDFPEPNWCWFDRETVSIYPRSEEKIRLYMRIPDSTYYYNRHWLLAIAITPFEIIGEHEGTASIALGAYLLYRIETQSNIKGTSKKDEQELFTIPSVVEFADVEPSKRYEKTVKIVSPFKNKSVRIERLDPSSDVAKLTILVGQGFVRLNRLEWLNYDTLVSLKDGTGSLNLKLQTPPEKEELNRNYEEILLLKCEDKKAFVRIRILPKKEEKEK